MASHAIERDLTSLPGLLAARQPAQWPFSGILDDLTSLDEGSPARESLLRELAEGSVVRLALPG